MAGLHGVTEKQCLMGGWRGRKNKVLNRLWVWFFQFCWLWHLFEFDFLLCSLENVLV